MPDLGKYAETEQDAVKRSALFKKSDPFPKVNEALLNSKDIEDYVRTTAMLFPFDKKKLKPASYAAKIKGDVYIYKRDNDDGPITVDTSEGWTLPKNSIAFVNIEPYFRLPN